MRPGAGTHARLADARNAFASNLRHADLRRAQGAFALAWGAEWAFTVALGVVAFREGGAVAVGLVGLLRMLPSAVLAPFAAALADRLRRETILIWGSVSRAGATAAAAALLAVDGPVVGVYALAVVSTVAVTPFRAAHSALLPSLCRTAEELTSSNVVRGMLDSVSLLLGPAIAAALIGVTSVEAVFMVAAGAALAAAGLLARLQYEAPPRGARPAELRVWQDVAEGVRAVRSDVPTSVMIAVTLAQTFTRGCLNVFVVVMAIELLGMGEPGVGVLTAAIGVGAVAGSVGASMLVGDHRLARWFGFSVALWGAPLALVGLLPVQIVAFTAMAIIGLSNALLDVGLFTLLARLAPDAVLARVFGVLESLIAVSVGLGSIAAPLLIELLGLRGALVVVGIVAPLAAVLGWATLRAIDAQMFVRGLEMRLLTMVPFLRPLPLPTLEQLARAAERVAVPAGAVLFREGDDGDAFYVIADGEVELTTEGIARHVLTRGEAFGEIALLRSVPRTMTAVACRDTTLYALRAEAFVAAVAGYSSSAGAADSVIARRMAEPVAEPA